MKSLHAHLPANIQTHLHPHSLRFRILLLLMLLIFFFSTLVAYNNFSAFSLLRKNVYRNTEDMLILYQEHLDNTLERTETWLYTEKYTVQHHHLVRGTASAADRFQKCHEHLYRKRVFLLPARQ